MSNKLLHNKLKILRQHLTELEKRLSEKEQQLVECEQSRALLQQSEQKYQQILDAIAQPVCVEDCPSGILWANKAFRDYYGLDDQQLADFSNTTNNRSIGDAVKFPLLNEAGQPYAVCTIARDISRQQAQKRLIAQQETTQVLSAATTVDGAISKLLESICQSLEWDLGEFWAVDQTANVLRCMRNWQVPSLEILQFGCLTS
jgi:PAS domain-containing protein